MPPQNIATIYDSAVRLMKPLSLDETYQVIIEEAQKLTNAEYCSIFLNKEGKLQRAYSTVPKKIQAEPRNNGNLEKVFRSGKTVILSSEEFKRAHPEYTGDKLKYMVLIPLSNEDETLGVLICQIFGDTTRDTQQIEILQLFGSLASLKLRNNLLVEELESAITTRDLFMSMASHEFKTPLTTISAYAQLMHKNILKGVPIQDKWVSTLMFATQRLGNLVNELLHMNQMTLGKFHYAFTIIDVQSEILEQIQEDFSVAYPNHKLSIKNELPKKFLLEIDREKFLQVLINILNNAAKFSLEPEPILLSVKSRENSVVFTIQDKGKGIAQEEQKHLFDEFYKAKDNTLPGMGLGLFISKRIVEEHGGKIAISSQLKKGTKVTVTLPAQQSTDAPKT